MSEPSKHGVRQHALAIATAIALSSTLFAASATKPDRVNVSALQPAETDDRFSVM